ncbi:MAG: hypothetical protein ACJ74Q_15200 [Pyrinomonadaceae bacterium]
MTTKLNRYRFTGTLDLDGGTSSVTRKAIGTDLREAVVNLAAAIQYDYMDSSAAPGAAVPEWDEETFRVRGIVIQPTPTRRYHFTAVSLDGGAVVHRFGVHYDDETKSVYAGALKVATRRSSGWVNQVDCSERHELHLAVARAFGFSEEPPGPPGEDVARTLSALMAADGAAEEEAAGGA